MKKYFFLGLLIGGVLCMSGQVNYDDVAVIINQNSSSSVQIGDHYCLKNSIPEENKIFLDVPELENINDSIFDEALQQIKTQLLAHPDTEGLNYLVTTKGVPLKVGGGECDSIPTGFYDCASFDSEIALLLGPYEDQIGGGIWVDNPYFGAGEHFDRGEYGIFIVSRLDAFEMQQVIDMIDRSGPLTPVDKDTAKFILDVSGSMPQGELNLFINMLQPAYQSLTEQGWNAILHADTLLLQNQNYVLGYAGILRMGNISLNNSWLDGSISTLAIGPAACSFNPDSVTTEALIIADLLSERATGGQGVVFGTFGSMLINYGILFSSYIDSIQKYNLGESYFMAIPKLSWQDVVVGDPKMSITTDSNTGISEPGVTSGSLRLWPVPASQYINIKLTGDNSHDNHIRITDIYGRVMKEAIVAAGTKQTRVDISSLAPGTYIAITEGADGSLIWRKIIKTR